MPNAISSAVGRFQVTKMLDQLARQGKKSNFVVSNVKKVMIFMVKANFKNLACNLH